MPKLHNISKKFLKEQGYNQCLANSQKILHQQHQQRQEEHRSNVRHTDTINNLKNEGESSGKNSGIQEDESKMKAGTKLSYPEEVEVDVLSPVDETNHQGLDNHNYHNEGQMNTTTTTSSMQPTVAAAAGVSTILQRRSNDCIWVQIGQTQHPAFELYNPENPDHDSSTVWVEYTSNKQRECVSRSQIKYGLQDRRRQRPKFYH